MRSRVEKRRASKEEHQPRARLPVVRHLIVILSTGMLVATLFTIFTPLGIAGGLGLGIDGVFRPIDIEDSGVIYPTSTPRPRPKIGLVAGHWGTDTGAVCPDGLAEVDINLDIATRVKQILVDEGFEVDLLMEYDSRLQYYQALTLVSIHADSCAFYGTEASGFKVAATYATARPDRANRLVSCLYSRYSDVTGMAYHAGVTDDMTSYHAFDEIHTNTAAAIIETGFLNLDRQILTQQPDLIAEGIARGILCYIRNEDASPPADN
ncbi:MAG: N-acetylmuramoyl-L-alanine amidase [Chloroflexota bacterium]